MDSESHASQANHPPAASRDGDWTLQLGNELSDSRMEQVTGRKVSINHLGVRREIVICYGYTEALRKSVPKNNVFLRSKGL